MSEKHCLALVVTQASTCGGSIKDFLEEWGGMNDSICCELQGETQHISSIKSKHYMGLGKHSWVFFLLLLVQSGITSPQNFNPDCK